MEKSEAKKRIAKLRGVINYHRHQYHVLDKQEISDEALDSLKKELFDLEQQFPDLVTPDSPTQRVAGEPLKAFKKVRHEGRMYSLNDAFSEDDLRAWFTRFENFFGKKISAGFYCDLKMDGLAVELVYEGGALAQGSTRGNGEIGEDITQNLKTVDAVPLRLASGVPEHLVVRGEVFMTKKEFARINALNAKSGEKIFANPRNMAAGAIRQLDPKVTASRKLSFYAYGIYGTGPEHVRHYSSREEEYAKLRSYGVPVNPDGKAVKDLDEVIAFHKQIAKRRESLAYEIDGIVVSVNDNELYARAGVVGKAPRGAIAYKFSPKEAQTIVEDITVQVGRTGVLTPVAKMRPVGVGGVTITHASLHNMDEIGRLGVTIGDTVIVSRAGDVIPQVTKVLKEMRTGKEKEFHMPIKCPICGSPVERDADGGVFYRCTSRNCVAQLRERLYHLVGRGAFDLRGLGPKIIDRFLEEGLIKDAADLFTVRKEDVAILERFGELSSENIIRSVESRKVISLPRFLFGLGIPHVGEGTADTLSTALFEGEKIAKPSDILAVIDKISGEKLQDVEDIGAVVAESIKGFFADARSRKLIEKFDAVGVRIAVPARKKKGPLAGKSFLFTGTLEAMSREEAKEKVKSLGGKSAASVTKDLDYLVVGAEPGSKFDKAKKLGVKVIDEKEFLGMIQ